MHDKTTFLNVDLDIASRRDLAPLVDGLHPQLFALHVGRIRGRYRARLELRTQPSNVDTAIRRMVSAVERLPARLRAGWKGAVTRDFDIGIQAGERPPDTEFTIAQETVRMAGRVGARIVITVYGASLSRTARSPG